MVWSASRNVEFITELKMARKITEIQDEILKTIETDSVLSEKLTSTSKTSIWRLFVYIISYALFLHEQIVDKNAENSRPHTKRWYREQALNFMDGHDLVWKNGQFMYDTTNMSSTDIAAAKPVTHVAITEAANGVLVIKTARIESDSETHPLDSDVHSRFRRYMEQIKDAGNRLSYINQPADELDLTLTVYVDDMLIDTETGTLVSDADSAPIEIACKEYLNQLEFNGAFVKTYLVDALQKVEGVRLPRVENLLHREWSQGAWEEIEEFVLPYSGHFKYQSLIIEYKSIHEVA